jgi:hypothetical protein
MDKHLDELKRLCRAEVSRSDAERINEGESIWLAGRPAAADNGFIGIAQDEDIRTIIREQDVKEVRKEGDLYLVRISTDANVIVRYERVTKAKPAACGCEAPSLGTTDESRLIARQMGDSTGPFGVPLGPCRLYIYCIDWRGIQICWWWITCPGKVGKALHILHRLGRHPDLLVVDNLPRQGGQALRHSAIRVNRSKSPKPSRLSSSDASRFPHAQTSAPHPRGGDSGD